MNSHDKNYDRLWFIKIITAAAALICTIKFSASVPAVLLSKISTDTHIENAAYEIAPDAAASVTSTETASETEQTTLPSSVTETSQETEDLSYETPEDIQKSQNEYLAAFANSSVGGSVEEVFFKTSGATDTVGEIAIKNATATKTPDFEALIKEGPALEISDKSEPTVLIFHTHTTESYLLADNGVFYSDYKTRSTDSTKNMIRVGSEICRVLESNGIGFIHDTNIYDESYDGAYARSRVNVQKYLEEYPSIQIVIDVHRDAIYYSDTSRCKPTAEINDRKAAQLMIISGTEEGYITDFPHWEDNLRFSLCFQKTAEKMYPGLMKPLYFCQRKYNMDTAKCSFLLEVGTDANTLDEAVYSGFLTGNVLTQIIKDAEK